MDILLYVNDARLMADGQTMKRIETYGPPPVGVDVWVDCGNWRCLGRLQPDGKWVDPYTGEELKTVVGYYLLD